MGDFAVGYRILIACTARTVRVHPLGYCLQLGLEGFARRAPSIFRFAHDQDHRATHGSPLHGAPLHLSWLIYTGIRRLAQAIAEILDKIPQTSPRVRLSLHYSYQIDGRLPSTVRSDSLVAQSYS